MHRIPRRRTVSRWSILLIAALVAVSCSSDDGEEAQDPSPSTTTTTTEAPSEGDADQAADEEPPAAPIPDWPLDDTPLTVDDGVEIGTLANGLTYYLRENGSPGGSVTVRLAVDAGSLQQDAADDGVAHFLEHMLFNGTERWPGNELDRVLQTLGAGIGPDINAYTSFDETVYELSVSTFDDDAVDTAFAVLAEWSARATIDPDEVLAERGVVRDEYRQRVENGAAAVSNALLEVYLTDTPYENRSPIGSVDAIENTEAPELRAFYETWYHPENMAVVVVGDLSTDDMLDRLEDAFADIEANGEAPPRAERLEIEPNPDGFAGVVTHPEEVVDNLSIDWLRPPSDSATVGGARADVLDDLIASMLGRRLDDAYLAGEFAVDRTPFISRFGVARHLEFFGTNLRGDDLAVAYAQLLGYLEAAAIDGFSADELDEAISQRAAGLDAWEETLGTTQDFSWSQAYVDHFLSGVGAEAPEATIERERAILAELTVDEVSDRWAFIHDRSGPIAVPLGSDEATLPTVEELEAIAASVEPIAPITPEADITELMQAPDPVAPESVDRRDGAFDTIIIRRYGNGATVIFEPSPIREGIVSLYAEGLGGASTLDIDDHNLAFVAASVVGRSGFTDVSTGQVNDFLADRTVALETWIADFAEGFEGTSGAGDVETLFQLVHLGITEPTVDPTVLTSVIVDAEGLLDRLDTDPGLQANAALSHLVLADTRYDGFATQEQLDALDAERLLELYQERLGGVDDLIDSVERVDIALPPDSGDAGMLLRWETPTSSPDDGAVGAMLEQIISSLIFDTAREELGASYSGSAAVFPTTVPRDGVTGFVAIDGDPARLDEIQDRLFADLERLATEGPSQDEYDRAQSILFDDLQFINNFELMFENIETERAGEPPEMSVYTRVGEVLDVSRAEIRQLAAELFDLDAYIEIRRS